MKNQARWNYLLLKVWSIFSKNRIEHQALMNFFVLRGRSGGVCERDLFFCL
jgi:hypothetical protein